MFEKLEISIMLFCVSIIVLLAFASLEGSADMETVDLWKLANEKRDVLRFSTLLTAQNVRDLLADQKGLDEAIDWCKQTAVTHVFVESFRDGYTAEREALERAKKAFLDAGIDVSGCVTP
jgi:hypothetical protein